METSLIGIAALCAVALVSGIVLGIILMRQLTAGSSVDMNEYNALTIDLAGLRTQAQEKSALLRKTEEDLIEQRRLSEQLGREVAAKDAEMKNLSIRLTEQKKEIEDINIRFNEEFKKIANQMLVDNSRKLRAETMEGIESILKPLRKDIDDFERNIAETREKQVQEGESLKAQINQLTGLNQMMAEEERKIWAGAEEETRKQGLLLVARGDYAKGTITKLALMAYSTQELLYEFPPETIPSAQ